MNRLINILILLLLFLVSVDNGMAMSYASIQQGELFVKINSHCDLSWEADDLEQTEVLQTDFPQIWNLLEANKALNVHKVVRFAHPELSYTYQISFDQQAPVKAFCRALARLDFVAYAEPVPLYSNFCLPDDPLYSSQWGAQNTNFEASYELLTGGTCDFDAVTCAEEVVIAVVDDAVLLTHEDLENQLWQNPGEIAGNGIDDDGNGYVDDIVGWDAADLDNDPMPDLALASADCFTHGTHVAGIVAAETNNAVGVASVGFCSRIMSVKSKPNGNCSPAVPNGFEAVAYAVAARADVISMSWGGATYSETYQELFNAAHELGIVLVAAAGNDAVSTPMYPASYEHVISVGASNVDNEITYFSNYGTTIDIMAPGQDIMSCLASGDDQYGEFNGTSMACPFVSGVIGMMLCFDPSISPDAVEDCIESTALDIDELNPGFEGQLGAGLIDVEEIFTCLQVPPVSQFELEFDTYCVGEEILFTESSFGPAIDAYFWEFEGGSPATSTDQNPTVSWTSAGNYTISLTTGNAYGSHTAEQEISIGPPSATLTGSTDIIIGTTVSLVLNYDGSFPIDIVLNNGLTDSLIANVSSSPYFINVSPNDTTIYTLQSVSNASCESLLQSDAIINVLVPADGSICRFSSIYGNAEPNNIQSRNHYDTVNEILYRSGLGPHWMAIDATNGNVIAARDFPGKQQGVSMVRADNGDFLMCAVDPQSSSSDWYVYRSDNEGALLWANRYASAGRQLGPSICKGNNDSFFISGWFNTSGGSSDDVGVLHIDGDGSVINAIATHVDGDDQSDHCISDGQGGLWLAGEVEHDRTIYVLHYDENLNVIEEYLYHPQSDYYQSGFFQLTATNDGGFAFTVWRRGGGEVQQYSSLIKLDADMQVEWATALHPSWASGSNILCRPLDLMQDSNGFLYLTGAADMGEGYFRPYYAKFNDVGDLIWSKTTLNTSGGLIQGNANFIAHNPDESDLDMLVGINISGNAAFGESDFALIRTDDSLTSCLFADVDFTSFSENWEELSVNSSTSAVNFNPIPLTNDWEEYIVNVETPCIECELEECDYTCTFDQSDSDICVGETVNFEANCPDVEAFFWQINDSIFAETAMAEFKFEEAGTYNVYLYTSNGNCTLVSDSIVTVGNPISAVGEDHSICIGEGVDLLATGGESYTWTPATGLDDPGSATPYASPDTSTVYHVEIIDQNDCLYSDSVIVWVSPLPVLIPAVLDTSLCPGDTLEYQLTNVNPISNYAYSWSPSAGISCTTCPNPFVTVTASTVYTLSIENSMGCMNQQDFSIEILSLEELSTEVDTSICTGSSYFAQGMEQTITGLYYDTLTSAAGCDSLILTDLTVMDSFYQEDSIHICEGDSALIHGVYQFTTGIYIDSIDAGIFCDSIYVTNLRVGAGTTLEQFFEICAGDSLLLAGEYQQVSGAYFDTIPAISGCDSIVSSTLTVIPSEMSEEQIVICEGETYFVAGANQTLSGIYTDTLVNQLGCDSLHVVDLQVEVCGRGYQIPNAFSPNEDGVNDRFRVFGPGVISYNMMIFNRWGDLLFEANSLEGSAEWDGTYKGEAQPLGVYVFVVELLLSDESTVEAKGNVTLVR